MKSLMLAYFALFCFGLGGSLLLALRKLFSGSPFSSWSERIIMQFGLGLASWPILSIIFHRLGLFQHWALYGVFAIPGLVSFAKDLRSLFYSSGEKRSIPRLISRAFSGMDIYVLVVVLLFVVHLYVMVSGSFAIPYLEDGDPYQHANGIKFVASTASSQSWPVRVDHYLEPYPPSYDFILGVLHQLHFEDLLWTMKFVNALFIALSTLFIYFFVLEFWGDKKRALWSSFVLTAIPSFSSHFIFAQALNLTIYFVALYCLAKIRPEDKVFSGWVIAGIITTASILVVQPTTGFFFGFIGGFILLYSLIFSRKLAPKIFVALAGGAALAFAVYWIPVFLKYSWPEIQRQLTLGGGEHRSIWNFADAPAIAYYTFSDFWKVPYANKIDNITGLGFMLVILSLVGIFYALFNVRKNKKLLVPILWFAFTLYGTLGDYFPVRMLPNRFWALLAFVVAIISYDGLVGILRAVKLSRKALGRDVSGYAVVAVVLLVIYSAFVPKYVINNLPWPQHVHDTAPRLKMHLWIKDNLKPNTGVFPACQRSWINSDNMLHELWDPELMRFANKFEGEPYFGWDYFEGIRFNASNLPPALDYSPERVASFLKGKKIGYVLFEDACVINFGANTTRSALENYVSSQKFSIAHQEEANFLLKIN
ncbi:phospholipid carrier-dependent glycosyltransferase [Candidatus Woesearchaeota archaeon]|nr:MAG: phospholipid carrier-dependent glycosyltransferase [Candidatus Woesearchaeota archaeon]